jgi:predicted MFS family arabinose efflux permease
MPKDFKKLMSARFCFTLAVQMQAIVLGWSMYDLTKDALFLGLIGLIEAIPALSLAIFAGYIVDRSRPLVVYKRIVSISLVSALILFSLHYFDSFWTNEDKIVLLFSSSFLTGCARSFSQPSMFSLVPKLIPRSLISVSSTWMTSAMQTARMAGPALGGILFGFVGAKYTALIICLFLVFTVIFLSTIEYKGPPNSPQSESPLKDELLSGARFVFTHPLLFPAMSLDMIAVLFGGVTALLPIYAAEVLHVGPEGLGVLRASPAIGAFLMSTLLFQTDIKSRSGLKLFWSVAGFGFSILIFSISSNFWISLFALFASGAFDSVSMVIRTTLVQLLSPDDMRGRISAINSIFIGSSNEIGEFESGVAVKLMGLVPAAIFGGVMCLTTVTVISFISPNLRKLNLIDLEK